MPFYALTAFRNFSTEIRQPAPYCPVVTELKGVTNIGLAALELLGCAYMKCKNSPHTNYHLHLANETFTAGLNQFLPGFVAVTGVYLGVRAYNNLEQ